MPLTYLNLSKSQSMTKIRDTRSAGRPIAVMTIKSVTNPASGIPAAPTLATVDVILGNMFYHLKKMSQMGLLKGIRSKFVVH